MKTAVGAFGISAAAIRKMFDGMWVNTIVLISPMRSASRGEMRLEQAATIPKAKKIAPAA